MFLDKLRSFNTVNYSKFSIDLILLFDKFNANN